jgi:hypothetical protein
LGFGGNPDELIVPSGIPQQGDDILVSHLDSSDAGIHNLGFVVVLGHEDLGIS